MVPPRSSSNSNISSCPGQDDPPPEANDTIRNTTEDGNGNGNDSDYDYDDYNGKVLPVVSDAQELLRRGICKVKLPEALDIARWADELSKVTPMNLCFEGDGEYAFYRNILDEPGFPFDLIVPGGGGGEGGSPVSEVGRSILRCFPVLPETNGGQHKETRTGEGTTAAGNGDEGGILSKELRLDDAFCVHYNTDQYDTSGKKHMDPSDITVNMCLHKSKDARGSHVLFYGTKTLESLGAADNKNENNDDGDCETTETETKNNNKNDDDEDDRFLVLQEPGYATIHFGDHTHETTSLRYGSRTNVILTYMYTDPGRSDASTRACFY